DYLWRKEGKAGAGPDGALTTPVSTPVPAANHDDASGPAENGPRPKRLNPIKLRQMKDRLQEVEEEIARLEAAIATAETALQNFVSAEETHRQTELLERSKSELASALDEWEELGQLLQAQTEA
ncbi:MAG TPA: ABC transporter ATP-binding protein, partial [Candidatus Angelobacter sp.]|nr:ABC transporter ATP-binding protein [Candidatus Angelobacter sp.]